MLDRHQKTSARNAQTLENVVKQLGDGIDNLLSMVDRGLNGKPLETPRDAKLTVTPATRGNGTIRKEAVKDSKSKKRTQTYSHHVGPAHGNNSSVWSRVKDPHTQHGAHHRPNNTASHPQPYVRSDSNAKPSTSGGVKKKISASPSASRRRADKNRSASAEPSSALADQRRGATGFPVKSSQAPKLSPPSRSLSPAKPELDTPKMLSESLTNGSFSATSSKSSFRKHPDPPPRLESFSKRTSELRSSSTSDLPPPPPPDDFNLPFSSVLVNVSPKKQPVVEEKPSPPAPPVALPKRVVPLLSLKPVMDKKQTDDSYTYEKYLQHITGEEDIRATPIVQIPTKKFSPPEKDLDPNATTTSCTSSAFRTTQDSAPPSYEAVMAATTTTNATTSSSSSASIEPEPSKPPPRPQVKIPLLSIKQVAEKKRTDDSYTYEKYLQQVTGEDIRATPIIEIPVKPATTS